MEKIELKQINNNIINLLDCESPQLIKDHFTNPNNCAQIILDQINNGYYNDLFLQGKYNVFVDVGANIGLLSLFVEPFCDKIYAFEPTPYHYDILKRLTVKFPAIQTINSAVASFSGNTKFYLDETNSTMNGITGRGHETEVVCIDFDEFNNYNEIDFMKVDIEGYENILVDKINFNNFPDIKNLYLEVHGDLENNRNKWTDKLQKIGYSVKNIQSDGILATKEMNCAVLTLYHENYQELANLVLPNWQEYCNKHNYNLIYHVGEYGPGQIGFQKIRFLYDQMFKEKKIDLSLVLDLDIIITNFGIKIEDFIDEKYSYFLTEDVNGENNGSFIIRKTQESKEILEYILNKSDSVDCEQNCIKGHRNSIELLKNNIKILEHPSINSYDYNLYPEFKHHAADNKGQWKNDHFIFHAPGLQLEKRLEIFKEKIIKI